MAKLICSRCGEEEKINLQAVAEQKKRGFISIMMWLLLAVCTLGAIIWIPLIRGKKSKTITYAICQKCGNRWKVK